MTNISMAKDKFRATMDWIEVSCRSCPDPVPGRPATSAMASTPLQIQPAGEAKPWGYQELVDWALTPTVIQIDNVETDDIRSSIGG